MSDWDPDQYLRFERERGRPASDLLSRVAHMRPARIADLGCGPGNSTALLRDAFPDAEITGYDSSEAMVERARRDHPDIRFEVCDVRDIDGGYDLLYSNACLQWVDGHEELIPRLMDRLKDGGVLAVQMPINENEPFFAMMRRTVSDPRWGLEGVSRPVVTIPPEGYVRILSGCSSDFELWETVYHHVLRGPSDIVEWAKGSSLRPYLDALEPARRAELVGTLVEGASELYEDVGGGRVDLRFRRLFFTTRRRSEQPLPAEERRDRR